MEAAVNNNNLITYIQPKKYKPTDAIRFTIYGEDWITCAREMDLLHGLYANNCEPFDEKFANLVVGGTIQRFDKSKESLWLTKRNNADATLLSE